MKQLFMILAMAVVSVTAANAQEEPKQVGEKVETKACCKSDKKEKSCCKSDKKECADKKKCSDKQECKKDQKECSSKGEKKSCCKKEA
jgi:hypothetical protein